MKAIYISSILIFSLACGNANNESSANNETFDLMEADYEAVMEVPATRQPAPKSNEITQKIIKTSGIDFETENIENTYKAIITLLPKFNAYIENENQSKSSQRIQYNLTIRVPSSVHDSLYSSIGNLAFKLDIKYANIQDVTERYYDLKLRIKNKKALEERYLALLQKATAIKDILEIEKNLNEIRTNIEQLQGQFNYLSKQVNLSTIHLSFYEILPYVYDSSQRKGFGARVLSGLNNGWQSFLSFLVGATTLWPFFILLIIGVYLFRKMKARRKAKK